MKIRSEGKGFLIKYWKNKKKKKNLNNENSKNKR